MCKVSQNVYQDKQLKDKYAGSSFNPFHVYLSYLQNPQQQRPVDSMNQAGQEYFFQAIQWQKVFDDVEQVILKNYKINGEIQENDQILNYVDILSKNDERSETIASDFNKMGPKVAKEIFRDVNEIIKKINSEIEAFCMKISDKGRIFIFLVTQILIFQLTEQLEIISENSPLRQFMARKKYEKKLFIAKLTNDDAELDKSLGIKLAEELCTKIYQSCKDRTVIKFQSLMKEKSDDFKKINFIRDLEDKCEKLYDQLEDNSQYVASDEEQMSKQELIDYYFEPKSFLEKKFKQKFKEASEKFLDQCKKEFFRTYQVQIRNLFNYFDRALQKLRQKNINKSSTIVFQAESSQDNNLRKQIDADKVKYETLQKKAASTFLNLLLSNQLNNDSLIYVDEYQFVCKEDYILPLSVEIQNPSDQQIDDEIYEIIAKNLVKDIQISQIHKFLEALIDQINLNDTLEKYLIFQINELQEKEKNLEGEQNQINSNDNDSIVNNRNISKIQEQEDENQMQSNQINSVSKPKIYQKKIIKNREDVIKDEELIGENLLDYKTKFLGCYEVCPLCRKQCDLFHNENIDDVNLIHDCQEGHQFQGFGGQKNYDNEVAITHSCNNIKDQDLVFYKGQQKRWLELKNSEIKNWNYNQNQSQVEKARIKQVKLWNLLGQEVCKRYRQEKNLTIEFQKAQNKEKMPKAVGQVHYILMLDDSGSMTASMIKTVLQQKGASKPGSKRGNLFDLIGSAMQSLNFDILPGTIFKSIFGKNYEPGPTTPWNDLMNSVQTFLTLLAKNQEQRNNCKVTCINHNQTAVVYFQEQIPDRSLKNKIIYRSGYNEFNNPLNMAFDICQETHHKYDKIIYYFMSDGGCSFPTNAVNRHKTDSTFNHKIEFYSVGFGDEADIKLLQEIADKMPNGKLVKALTAKELTESLKRIVINLYGEQ